MLSSAVSLEPTRRATRRITAATATVGGDEGSGGEGGGGRAGEGEDGGEAVGCTVRNPW